MSATALVHRDQIDLRIAVMPEDFMLMYGLYADAQDRISKADVQQSAQRHKEFLLRNLVIRDTDGNALSGRVYARDRARAARAGPLHGRFDVHLGHILHRVSPRQTADASHLSGKRW